MPTATRRQARETGRNSMTSKLQQKLSVPFSTSGPTSRPHPSTGPGAHTARRHPKHLEHYAAVFTPEANCHEDTLHFYMLNCETLPYPPWSTRAMLGGGGALTKTQTQSQHGNEMSFRFPALFSTKYQIPLTFVTSNNHDARHI